MREHSQFLSETLLFLVGGRHDRGEGANRDRVSNHSDEHEDDGEHLLGSTLRAARRDVSVADGGDGGDDEVERGEVLLLSRRLVVAVAEDPASLLEANHLGEEEPQTREVVAEDEEEEEEREQSFDLDSALGELLDFFAG